MWVKKGDNFADGGDITSFPGHTEIAEMHGQVF